MESRDASEQAALGRRVRRHRESALLSQVQLDERIGLDPTAVSNIERGVRKVSSLELSRIARALSVSPLAILEDESPVGAVASITTGPFARPVPGVETDEPGLARALAEICQRYGVAELYAFGSTARGESSVTSDVDLLYVLAPGVSLGFAIDDLEDELSRLFARPVDLVSKRSLHPLLREQVLAEARPLHAA